MNQLTPRTGDNSGNIDYAQHETDRLNIDYLSLKTGTLEMIEEARAIPLPIADDDHKLTVAKMLKRFRDAGTSIEGTREIEKLPHLRRGNAVDTWFSAMLTMLKKKNKGDRNAIGDDLQEALTTYDTKKLLEEQARREAAAAQAQREADAKAKLEREAAARAEEARLAAERAKLPHTQDAKAVVADAAEAQAIAANVDARMAETRADQTRVDSFARPADIMRQRHDGGVLTTMATESYSVVTDHTLIDLNKLRPYLKLEAIEQALRAYAASVGYSEDAKFQIPGAKFGKRPKSVVR